MYTYKCVHSIQSRYIDTMPLSNSITTLIWIVDGSERPWNPWNLPKSEKKSGTKGRDKSQKSTFLSPGLIQASRAHSMKMQTAWRCWLHWVWGPILYGKHREISCKKTDPPCPDCHDIYKGHTGSGWGNYSLEIASPTLILEIKTFVHPKWKERRFVV